MQGNQKIKIIMNFQWKLLVFLKILQFSLQEESLENVSENNQFLHKGCAYFRNKLRFIGTKTKTLYKSHEKL